MSGEAPGGGGFCFQVKASPARGFMRVWGISETKQIGEGLSAGWLYWFSQGICVCVLMVCFVVMACCWVSGATRLLFYRSPLDVGKILLVAA